MYTGLRRVASRAAIPLVALLLCAAPSRATFHLWIIEEVYSNASGTVQFVELFTSFDGQQELFSSNVPTGQAFTSNAHTFNFLADLPSAATAGHHFMLATPGYFALSGVPAADYNLGVNNFFSVTGDTLNFAGVSEFIFGSGELPTDGVNSLNLNIGVGDHFAATNSPTNFAGATGQVPEPASLCGFLLVSRLLLRRL
ncbi:MAG: hypothetical protein ACREJC_17070 [Tepidisphaeraceae bacterium]